MLFLIVPGIATVFMSRLALSCGQVIQVGGLKKVTNTSDGYGLRDTRIPKRTDSPNRMCASANKISWHLRRSCVEVSLIE